MEGECERVIVVAKLLVIVGPTASGKSGLAMKIAKLQNGEIICADSRTVYKGLNIGTAKPSSNDQEEVPHHLLDVAELDQPFTAADFKQLAESAILDIQGRGKQPIMVGGSGMYVDSVLYNYEFSEPGAARDLVNPRHLSADQPRRKSEIRDDCLVIGIDVPRHILKERITNRVDDMLHNGFLEEVKEVYNAYPASKALLAPGYKAFLEHIQGRVSMEEAKALFIKNDFNLAKRQVTWFKRNKSIHWLSNPNTYVEDTLSLLNKLQ